MLKSLILHVNPCQIRFDIFFTNLAPRLTQTVNKFNHLTFLVNNLIAWLYFYYKKRSTWTNQLLLA